MNSDFHIHAQLEAFEKADDPDGHTMRIGGICTTDHLDKQSERVLQDGLDFTPFLADGWFNDNHGRKTTDVVGYPTGARFVKKGERLPSGRPARSSGWWTEGYLLNTEEGRKLWGLTQSLQNSPRRLGFSIEGKVVGRDRKNAKIITRAVVRNVAVTHCFPGETAVVGTGREITRRPYSGPMVEIVLASGHRLTGTPNHPVLTQRGWVALGELDERHDRVGCRFGDAVSGNSLSTASRPLVVADDVQDVPATFVELFDLARLTGPSLRVRPVLEGDFHGDVLADGEVDIVRPNRGLQASLDAAFFEQFGEDTLAASDLRLGSLSRLRESLGMLWSHWLAAARSVCSGNQALAFGGTSGGVASELFFTARSVETRSLHDLVDGLATHPELGRDGGRAISRQVQFSDLHSLRVVEFSGHVYNLETTHGWYAANGVVAHNCPVNPHTELVPLVKALSAGHAIASGDLNQGPGDGGALRQESLEGGPNQQGWKAEDDPEFETLSEDQDGGEPNNGGWAGLNLHKSGGRIKREPTDEELLKFFGPTIEELQQEDSDRLGKSEAAIFLRQRRPDLTDAQIEQILASAGGQ